MGCNCKKNINAPRPSSSITRKSAPSANGVRRSGKTIRRIIK